MDQEANPLAARMTHRLTLDSSEEERRAEEERREQEQYERMKEEKRKRKQQKRRQRQEQERLQKEKAKQAAQKKKKQLEKYNDPAKLFEPDSDSGDKFARIQMKINQMYPKFSKRRVQSSSEEDSESGQSQEQSEESESSEPKRQAKKTKKIQKKIERRRNREEQSNQRRIKVKASVKVEHQMTVKEKLVQQLGVRWWYALPEWPPADYNYEAQLNKIGYRLVEGSQFKLADQVENGLTKVTQLDGYPGVFRAKNGLVDVRLKNQAPSIDYFSQMSEEELNRLLKKAVKNQLEELLNVQFKQSGEDKLATNLEKKIISLK